MSLQRKINRRAQKRATRVRSRLTTNAMPRVSVFRSLKHIYGQLIDDKQGTTLASSSSLEITITGDKKEVAKAVGKALAERALAHGIKQVAFDRGSYLYHGRVQALAEGLREGGLQV